MATAMKIDRLTLRQIAAAVALAMLTASLPATGVIVVADRSGPCFTLDICHPLQSLDRVPDAIAIARPAPPASLSFPARWEPAVEPVAAKPAGFAAAPDPPPPKPLA